MQKLRYTRPKSGHKLWAYIATGVALAVILLITVIVIANHKNTPRGTGDQTTYNNNKKGAVVDNGGQPVSDTATTNGKVPTPSGTYEPPTTSNGISFTPSVSGSNVTVATKLVGYSSGTCTLTVVNNGRTNVQTAPVIFAPDYSSCAGFSVPINSLGDGTWNITLNVLSGGITTTKSTTYGVAR